MRLPEALLGYNSKNNDCYVFWFVNLCVLELSYRFKLCKIILIIKCIDTLYSLMFVWQIIWFVELRFLWKLLFVFLFYIFMLYDCIRWITFIYHVTAGNVILIHILLLYLSSYLYDMILFISSELWMNLVILLQGLECPLFLFLKSLISNKTLAIQEYGSRLI